MSNGILERQQANLDLWLAQKRLYSRAKTWGAVQTTLAAPVGVGLALAAAFWPAADAWAKAGWFGLFGLAVWLLDLVFFTPAQRQLRARAARVQEAYDCAVLQLPWNDGRVDEREPPETVAEFSGHPTEKERSKGTTWYLGLDDAATRGLPLAKARILCQRQNVHWDAAQRLRFYTGLKWTLLLLLMGSVAAALASGWTVSDLLLKLLLPLMPAVRSLIQFWTDQDQAIQRLGKLKSQTEKLLALSDSDIDEAQLSAGSRRLQDQLYEHRRSAMPVPDWLYKMLAPGHQRQADKAMQALSGSVPRP